MANCTGVAFGQVRRSGAPLSDIVVDLTWIQKEGATTLKIGGNDDLNTFVPTCTTPASGKYIIPFFWASEEVPGPLALVRAVEFVPKKSAITTQGHAQAIVSLDVRQLLGVAFPPAPTSFSGATGIFLKFWQAADQELKGTSILTRFIGGLKLSAVQLQGLYINFDFLL
jgi:hypothetical protein